MQSTICRSTEHRKFRYSVGLITHAGGSRCVGRVISGICDFVRLSVGLLVCPRSKQTGSCADTDGSTTRHNHEKSHLQQLAIREYLQGHSRSSQLLPLDRPYTTITSCQWPLVTTSVSSTVSLSYYHLSNVRDCL